MLVPREGRRDRSYLKGKSATEDAAWVRAAWLGGTDCVSPNPPRLSVHAVAGLDPDGRGRAVAVRGRPVAARGAVRDAPPSGRAHPPLRRRRRALRPADHDGADRAPVDLAARAPARRRPRLPSHGGGAAAALRGRGRG